MTDVCARQVAVVGPVPLDDDPVVDLGLQLPVEVEEVRLEHCGGACKRRHPGRGRVRPVGARRGGSQVQLRGPAGATAWKHPARR
eukprot:760385-Alexandrium_andersonii.AAC.1